ncbi:MAG: ribbon-helix-helix protein, CopG family [Blastochloris sp.]|nr:ribbon-helix-helix protein, CopG family [Blastochloris sp.]
MTRTQIQFPEPLYQRLKEIAEQQDWSLSEVMRKAAEHFVRRFPEEPNQRSLVFSDFGLWR